MHRTARVLATTAVLALLAGACGAPDDPSPSAEPGDEVDGGLDGTDDGLDDGLDGATDTDAPADDGEGSVTLEGATEVAVADLAATTGTDEADIEVVSAEEVTWSDGSLGCPEPDGMYTQALVPGYRIVLSVAGEQVDYHGAAGSPPFRCDDPSPPLDAGT
ncbi:hypothetical protein [Nitriliruptor alkaliphilus]|uniref:hypothetical protein n=1 Tax=Nitriliruptor alkaliphilus TaxID=427918 RepID=UPI0006969D7F|nr:hypothetical protein [Nitriliruptor alkaliphilus]